MGGLISAIMGMLGGGAAGGGGGMGGMLGGMMGGGGGSGGGDPFSTGMQHGISLGGGGGGGGSSHTKNTKDVDHELGLSALQQYKDMSQPHQDYSGMNQAMQFSQMQKPGGPFAQPMQPATQNQPNAYVQALLQYMHGGGN